MSIVTRLLGKIEFYLSPINSTFRHSNVYGFSRTILAIGTIITLIFNNTKVLFTDGVGTESPQCVGLIKFSIYCIFNSNLEIGRFISIIILLIVASGWRPRLTGFFHWWMTFSLNSSALIVDGGDQVASVLTLLLLPICLTDGRKWHWEKVSNEGGNSNQLSLFIGHSALLMIKLQVAFIYLNAAVEKFKVEEWINGTALYYWFLNPYMGANGFVKPILFPLITNSITTPLLTWGVLVFELTLFIGIAMSHKYKNSLLQLGILFHLMIVVVHGLFTFFLSMSAALILYLRPWNYEFNFQRIPFIAFVSEILKIKISKNENP
jgi:antimicrobial peptide system SdpB family protein